MSDQDRPLTADELEQRRRADGSLDGYETLEDAPAADDDDYEPGEGIPDHPLTADEIEQQQVVEYDEDDQPLQ